MTLTDNNSKEVSVIILAGGKPEDPLAQSHAVAHPCLIEINGKTIISRSVEAFSKTSGIAEIIVISFPAVLATLPPQVKGLEAKGQAVENLALGLAACTKEWLIAAPADMPWLTAPAVTAFLEGALATGAELVYPIVARPLYEAKFPGGRRTYVTLREATFTGGNLAFARHAFLQAQLPMIERLFELRKNPLGLARLLGFGFVLGLLLKRLDLPALEARASQITGGRTVALPVAFAELGFDIDKAEDLEMALSIAPQMDGGG
jgi:GTP:adenosylcobinamide-phosphate guanylyltransferase